MEIYDIVIELLDKEREIFLKVESLTNLLLTSEIEELTDILEERGALLQKAIATESEIKNLVLVDEYIRDILNNNSDMSNLSVDMRRVFEASMRVKAVINRINNLESDVTIRLESERSLILERLESLNRSSDSVAKNYKRSVQMSVPHISLMNKDKSI